MTEAFWILPLLIASLATFGPVTAFLAMSLVWILVAATAAPESAKTSAITPIRTPGVGRSLRILAMCPTSWCSSGPALRIAYTASNTR